MNRRGSSVTARAAVTTLSGVAAVAAVMGEVAAPLQPVLVLWFVLVCPGMALVGLVRPPSGLFALTLSVAVSCALLVVVSQALLYAGLWHPLAGLLVLVVLTAVAAAADVRGDRRRRQLPVDPAVRGA